MTSSVWKPVVNIVTFFILLVSLFHVSDRYCIITCGLSILVGIRMIKLKQKMSIEDIILILILIYNLLILSTSINYSKSIVSICSLFFLVIFFFHLRYWHFVLIKVKSTLLSISIIFFIISIFTVIAFLFFDKSIKDVGFDNLYDFRYKFRPLGNISNLWSTILLACLGVTALTLYYWEKSRYWILILLIWCLLVLCMLLSFSRGIYLSLFFELFAFSIILVSSRYNFNRKLLLLGPTLFLLIIFYLYFPIEVDKAIGFNKTISQQRSISERMASMDAAINVLKNYPYFGVGNGNYSLGINLLRYENDNNSYTSYAPNSFVQLLVEQGVIGMILWFFFFIVVCKNIFNGRKNIKGYIILIGLIGIAIREMTFPVFFIDVSMGMLVFIMIAILLNQHKRTNPCIGWCKTNYVGILFIVIGLSVLILSSLREYYEKNNIKFVETYNEGKYDLACKLINKTDHSVPYLLNRSIIYEKLYLLTKDSLYLVTSQNCIEKAVMKNPHDLFLKYNLYRFLQKYDSNSSFLLLDTIIKIAPENVLYLITDFKRLSLLGKFNEAKNQIINAILLSPTILESELWQDMSEEIPKFHAEVSNRLYEIVMRCDFQSECNPIILAKYGKILFFLKYPDEAYLFLRKAINLLPNLRMPWYYLGMLEEYQGNKQKATEYYLKTACLSQYTYIHKDVLLKYINHDNFNKNTFDEYFIYQTYKSKYLDWYGTNLIFWNGLE